MINILVNELEKTILKKLRDHAESNVISAFHVLRCASGKEPPIGDDKDRCATLPGGYRVVYSIEDHGAKTYRHLSVSQVKNHFATRPEVPPSPRAVAEIAKELGFDIGDDLLFTKQSVIPDVIFGLLAPNILEVYK